MKQYTIKDLKDRNLIIFEAVMGSYAYGTVLPTSDRDIRGVWIQPLEEILQYGYAEQVADDTNDIPVRGPMPTCTRANNYAILIASMRRCGSDAGLRCLVYIIYIINHTEWLNHAG